MKLTARPLSIMLAMTIAAVPMVALPTLAGAESTTASGSHGWQWQRLTVAAGQTKVISQTTKLSSLTIADGGVITAPAGYSLTLTVNGVETGSKINETGGVRTVIAPGTYCGKVILTVTEQNLVSWQPDTLGAPFEFRQALYVGAHGVDENKSVTAAVRRGTTTDDGARNLYIKSTGEAFNGVYVNDRNYTLTNPKITLDGNGRSDFVGFGAAITATGTNSRVVVDGAKINNEGVVRTAVVADGGSNVVVKNSTIRTKDGALPPGYQSTVDLAYMQQAPWMLGIVGTTRATNLLGTNTQASYINSSIYAEGWGVLSVDTGTDMKLTSINSTLTTGTEGYGSYVIGNATEEFLGSRLNVDTYAAINRGGSIHYGDSTQAAVAQLNSTLNLGLTDRELRNLPVSNTIINSDKWGVMWHGAGSVNIDGGTVVNTKRTTLLDKGQEVDVTVDGSRGAKINPANGIIFQAMEDDDPGPQMVDGKLLNTGVYTEPTGDPAKVTTFDVTAVHDTDAVATFSNIDLKGDFYNGIRGNNPAGPFGPGLDGKNLVLTFNGTKVSGVISSSETRHNVNTITSADYEQLGVVNNTAEAAINNGVIVTLNSGSKWTVKGTSYLTKLTVAADASATTPRGNAPTMTVNGIATPIVPGNTYTGAIVIS